MKKITAQDKMRLMTAWRELACGLDKLGCFKEADEVDKVMEPVEDMLTSANEEFDDDM